jgi:hypothetical protein
MTSFRIPGAARAALVIAAAAALGACGHVSRSQSASRTVTYPAEVANSNGSAPEEVIRLGAAVEGCSAEKAAYARQVGVPCESLSSRYDFVSRSTIPAAQPVATASVQPAQTPPDQPAPVVAAQPVETQPLPAVAQPAEAPPAQADVSKPEQTPQAQAAATQPVATAIR